MQFSESSSIDSCVIITCCIVVCVTVIYFPMFCLSPCTVFCLERWLTASTEDPPCKGLHSPRVRFNLHKDLLESSLACRALTLSSILKSPANSLTPFIYGQSFLPFLWLALDLPCPEDSEQVNATTHAEKKVTNPASTLQEQRQEKEQKKRSIKRHAAHD